MNKYFLAFLFLAFMTGALCAQEISLADAAESGTITFSFKDADIRNVLRLISTKSSVNIVYGPDVTGIVNMELRDVPWEQALNLVLDINGFAYQKEGNVIKVLKKEDVSKEPLSTEVFILNYATAKDAIESVKQMLTERGSIKTDARSNTIIVTDVPVNINKIETVLLRLDARTPQVLIETKIIEMSNSKQKELGLKWTSLKEYTVGVQSPTRTYNSDRSGGQDRSDVYTTTQKDDWQRGVVTTPTGGTYTDTSTYLFQNNLDRLLTDTFTRTLQKSDIRSAILSADNFELVLSALQENTDADLLSNPRILTANNEPAQIKVVQQYPIPNYTFDTSTSTFTISGFDYKDIGVTFDVTPNISSDGYITMKIEPQTSTLLGTIPFTASGSTVNIPLIGVKKAASKLVIRSGDTLAVGGLVDQDYKTTITKVPLLGDIPVLGRLFRHDNIDKVKKDIIFFITATVIDDETKKLIYETDTTVTESPEVYDKMFPKAEPVSIPVLSKGSASGNRGVITAEQKPAQKNIKKIQGQVNPE